MSFLLSSLSEDEMIRWSDFDPIAVIDELHKTFNLGSHFTFFERAGVGHGYMDRPCIDPLDHECPPMAKNYFDICPHVERIREIARKYGKELKEEVKEAKAGLGWLSGLFGRKKRQAEPQMIHPAQPADSISTVQPVPTTDVPITEAPFTTTTMSLEEVRAAEQLMEKNKIREAKERKYSISHFNCHQLNCFQVANLFVNQHSSGSKRTVTSGQR